MTIENFALILELKKNTKSITETCKLSDFSEILYEIRRLVSHCLNVSNEVFRRHMKLENVSFETIYVVGLHFRLAYNTNLSSSDGLF